MALLPKYPQTDSSFHVHCRRPITQSPSCLDYSSSINVLLFYSCSSEIHPHVADHVAHILRNFQGLPNTNSLAQPTRTSGSHPCPSLRPLHSGLPSNVPSSEEPALTTLAKAAPQSLSHTLPFHLPQSTCQQLTSRIHFFCV